MSFAAYILESELSGRFYIGSTNDIRDRILRHNAGETKSTKAYRPWKIAYVESFETKKEAVAREKEIKGRKSRKYIELLVRIRGVAQPG